MIGTRRITTTLAVALLLVAPIASTYAGGTLPTPVVQNLPSGQIWSIAMHPSGAVFAVSSDDGLIAIWQLDPLRKIADIPTGAGRSGSTTFSSDGTRLLLETTDGNHLAWRVGTWTPLPAPTYPQLQRPPNWLPVRQNLIDARGNVRLKVDRRTPTDGTVTLEGLTVPIGPVANLYAVAVSDSARRLAVSGFDGNLRIWSVDPTPQPIEVPRNLRHFRNCLWLDDHHIVLADWIEAVKVDIRDWSVAPILREPKLTTDFHLAFSHQQSLLVIVEGNTMKTLGLNGRLRDVVGPSEVFGNQVASVEISPMGRYLSVGKRGATEWWDLRNGALRCRVPTRQWAIPFGFDADDSNVWLHDYDESVSWWNVGSCTKDPTRGQTLSRQYSGLEVGYPDGRIAFDELFGSIAIKNASTGDIVRVERDKEPYSTRRLYGSPDGRFLCRLDVHGEVSVYDTITLELRFRGSDAAEAAFSQDSALLVTTNSRGRIQIYRTADWTQWATIDGHVFVPEGDRTAQFPVIHDVREDLEGVTIWGASTDRRDVAALGRLLVDRHTRFERSSHDWISSDQTGAVKVWRATTPALEVRRSIDGTITSATVRTGVEAPANIALRAYGFNDGTWIVASDDGTFDTNSLEKGTHLNWVFPDRPLRALPMEVFMRDYYEPRLLSRMLAGEKPLKRLKSLDRLNRVQPIVTVRSSWQDKRAGIAKVIVTAQNNRDPHMINGKTWTQPYDLRVFRDGQLVGWAPTSSVQWQAGRAPNTADSEKNARLDLARWRQVTRINAKGPHGKKAFRFLVQVPRRPNHRSILFTAYAFNDDRVKSLTASSTLTIEDPLETRDGTAYLISVGVNTTETPGAWTLQYAADDAREMSRVVGDRLAATKQFGRVTRIQLVSADNTEPQEGAATRKNVAAVLHVLAGRRVPDDALKQAIPGIDTLAKAQPEDLVLLAFSSHGYTDVRGVFHLVLADIGPNTPQDKITAELQRRSLSSDQLSGWLRDVDAGEIVMVVDSCHSAATVDAEGFKPGPMGSRGLGQLAYDKGMRILAASQSEQSAVERNGIRHGLLTYALLSEGLEQGLADFQPPNGTVTMAEWLAYGEWEVPKLFAEGDTRGSIQRKSAPDGQKDAFHGSHATPQSYQQPVLFDFNRKSSEISLGPAQ